MQLIKEIVCTTDYSSVLRVNTVVDTHSIVRTVNQSALCTSAAHIIQ